jgi:hypothetical protein
VRREVDLAGPEPFNIREPKPVSLPISASVEVAWLLTALAAALAVLAIGFRGVRGTTLFPAWMWASAAVVVLAGVELAGIASAVDPNALQAARFAAVVMSFAPGVAVLGAKRPQDRAWQLVVAALVAMFALPAIETFVYRPGSPPAVHAVRAGFLTLLVIVTNGNYLPTRLGLSALLTAAGQIVLLLPHLGWIDLDENRHAPLVGFTLIVLGMISAWGFAHIGADVRGWQRVWRDFRNAYGVVWSVRVAERFNTAARASDEPARIRWRGIEYSNPSYSESKPALDANSERRLRALLLRFVRDIWIEQRRGTP